VRNRNRSPGVDYAEEETDHPGEKNDNVGQYKEPDAEGGAEDEQNKGDGKGRGAGKRQRLLIFFCVVIIVYCCSRQVEEEHADKEYSRAQWINIPAAYKKIRERHHEREDACDFGLYFTII
jgi:hypothetical protein